jgi:hypothetical protein
VACFLHLMIDHHGHAMFHFSSQNPFTFCVTLATITTQISKHWPVQWLKAWSPAICLSITSQMLNVSIYLSVFLSHNCWKFDQLVDLLIQCTWSKIKLSVTGETCYEISKLFNIAKQWAKSFVLHLYLVRNQIQVIWKFKFFQISRGCDHKWKDSS